MKTIQKAHVYVTHGRKLLVFEHADFPAAGLQIPGGRVEADETPDEAAPRELFEETGLENVELVRKLGSYVWDSRPLRNELEERHVYHFKATGIVPDRWKHAERHSGGGEKEIWFQLFWRNLDDEGLPILVAGQGVLLPALMTHLNSASDE